MIKKTIVLLVGSANLLFGNNLKISQPLQLADNFEYVIDRPQDVNDNNDVQPVKANRSPESLFSEFYTRSHSPFFSWLLTIPFVPGGHIYNKEYKKSILLSLIQIVGFSGLFYAGYNHNESMFNISGAVWIGGFAFSKIDGYASARRYNIRLQNEMGFVPPQDMHGEDLFLVIITSLITFFI